MNIIIPSNKIYKTTIDSKISDNRFGKIVVNMDSHSVEDKNSTILETVKIDAATSGTSFSDYEGGKSSPNYEQGISRYLYAGFNIEYLSSRSTKFSINRFGDYYLHDFFNTYVSDINFKITSSVIKTSFQVASNGNTITFNTQFAKAQETNQSTFTLNSKNGYEFVELFSGNASSQNLISFKFTDIYDDPSLGITSDKKDQSEYELRVSKSWLGDGASFWKNHFYVSHEVKDDKIDITLHYTPKLKFYAAAWFGSQPSETVSTIADGVLFELVPQSVTIALDSKFKSIKKGETALTYRSIPEHNTFSIKGRNELLQYESLIDGKDIMGAFTPIVNSWKNGKETATLLCSVGDYYDENGNRVVSTETADKMTFNLYDEVLPCYKTPYGDAPMSMADGKPKIFKVLGSKVYFDGAVWQEISLQESGTTDYIVQNGTRGLSYSLREDGGSYYCAGIGDATESEISIASIVNGVPVTSVGSEAFRANQQIKSAIIPNGISRINSYAFFNSGLVLAELPDTLQYIGDVAFAESQLTKIEIPQSVSQIELGAFNHCNNLNTAIIKANIDKIEDAAFSDCHNLRTVKFPSSVKKIGKMSFMNAAFDSIELGNVQEIGESAFRNCLNLKNVSLNKCVDIGNYAFATCGKIKVLSLNKNGVRVGKSAFSESGIESLTIPDNILSVGQQAFANCPNLKSVTIENGVNIALIDYTAFEGSPIENATSHIDTILLIPTTHLKKYTISGGETIPSGIFTKYTALENVIIGNTVKTIGDEAFYNCRSLVSVTIGNGVTSIGSKAFQYCTSLTDVYITDLAAWCEIQFAASTSNPMNYAKNLYLNNKLVTELVIPDSVTSIGNYAFYNCDDFISVNIPDSVTSIGDGAFMRSTALESVTIGNGVTSIGFRAFGGCYSLVSITIPFVGATKDGASNTHFGYIFGASSYSGQKDYMSQVLKTVVITGGTKIDSNAFYNCSIESVTIPDGVMSIGDSAFYDCGLLTSVTIPDSVTSIGSKAFDYCYSLSDVYYTGTEEQWNDITIGQRNTPLITAKKHFAK